MNARVILTKLFLLVTGKLKIFLGTGFPTNSGSSLGVFDAQTYVVVVMFSDIRTQCSIFFLAKPKYRVPFVQTDRRSDRRVIIAKSICINFDRTAEILNVNVLLAQ